MVDYHQDLLADLDSTSEEEQNGGFKNSPSAVDEFLEANLPTNEHHQEKSFETRLKEVIKGDSQHASLEERLNYVDVDGICEVALISKVRPLIPDLRKHIELYSNSETTDFLELLSSVNDEESNEEYNFIFMVNELTEIIRREIALVHSYVKTHYKVVFPELEALVLNPTDYARIVLLVKQDLGKIKSYEKELHDLLSSEKVLVIVMAAVQQSKTMFTLSDKEFGSVADSCHLLIDLSQVMNELSDFISNKLSVFAPNVSAIVGPITTSQLLIATGSLRELSLTPSCNLPSLGVKDLSSKSSKTPVRQTGYLYHSDLVVNLPKDYVKQAMRIISGKVVLAARIDLTKSCPSGSLGEQYRGEIIDKIDKLLAPPEASVDKALPAPIEQRSKKRGGRRFRKMKERLQMSQLRSAQNKMAFGQQEETVTDSYGEEIGLGMMRSSGGKLTTNINTNTNAKLLKDLANKLQKEKALSNIFNQDLDSIILTPSQQDRTTPSLKGATKENIGGNSQASKWFNGMLKRKRED